MADADPRPDPFPHASVGLVSHGLLPFREAGEETGPPGLAPHPHPESPACYSRALWPGRETRLETGLGGVTTAAGVGAGPGWGELIKPPAHAPGPKPATSSQVIGVPGTPHRAPGRRPPHAHGALGRTAQARPRFSEGDAPRPGPRGGTRGWARGSLQPGLSQRQSAASPKEPWVPRAPPPLPLPGNAEGGGARDTADALQDRLCLWGPGGGQSCGPSPAPPRVHSCPRPALRVMLLLAYAQALGQGHQRADRPAWKPFPESPEAAGARPSPRRPGAPRGHPSGVETVHQSRAAAPGDRPGPGEGTRVPSREGQSRQLPVGCGQCVGVSFHISSHTPQAQPPPLTDMRPWRRPPQRPPWPPGLGRTPTASLSSVLCPPFKEASARAHSTRHHGTPDTPQAGALPVRGGRGDGLGGPPPTACRRSCPGVHLA